jgi:HK97 family phage prohead protease
MDRAYSILNVKSFDDDERIISGIATTPTTDRVGDVVNPLGAKFALPIPFLWQHRHDEPVGHVEFAEAGADGIPFRARIEKLDEPGTLKDRLDEAWQSLKLKLVRFVSIGFNPLEYAFIEGGGIRYDSWEWLELSAVTIPAQPDAVITAVKKFDAQLRAAEGVPPPEIPTPPADVAAIGKSVRVVRLDEPARDRAKSFQIRTIIRT